MVNRPEYGLIMTLPDKSTYKPLSGVAKITA